ncbi:hypothetical protein [Tannerella sp.]|uniref:hypothetical protein n=1 Tax=Tannerella sp. TaxID=2382127 RepID=UPI003FA1CBEC
MKKWILLMCVFVCGQAMVQDDFESLESIRLSMTADGTQYVRAFIEESLQGEEGYHLYLSCDRNKHYK